jgi:hypothetical protein
MWTSLADQADASQNILLQHYPRTQTAPSAIRAYAFGVPDPADLGTWPSFDFVASNMLNFERLRVSAEHSDLDDVQDLDLVVSDYNSDSHLCKLSNLRLENFNCARGAPELLSYIDSPKLSRLELHLCHPVDISSRQYRPVWCRNRRSSHGAASSFHGISPVRSKPSGHGALPQVPNWHDTSAHRRQSPSHGQQGMLYASCGYTQNLLRGYWTAPAALLLLFSGFERHLDAMC